MPPPYLDFLDPECLPQGLTDQAYATWIQALRDLCNSHSLAHLEHSYQFYRGFVQALQDTQVVEPQVYLRLEAPLNEAWLERMALFQARG
jgi:4-alpha-glucanotransferase